MYVVTKVMNTRCSVTKTDYWQRKICGIYLIQHKETSRAYVGQSIDCIKRWKSHTTPGKKSSGIAGAIKEQGVDKFIFCILEECSKDLLNEREKYWIAKYDCVEPNGWNRTSGGSSGTEVSSETKKKISAAKKGKKFSDEHKAKMSAAQMGNTSCLGKKFSEETRSKMSAAQKGNTNGLGKKPPRSPEHIAKHAAVLKEYYKNKKSQPSSEK